MTAADVPPRAGVAAALWLGGPDQAFGHDLDLMPGPASDAGAGELRAVKFRDCPLGDDAGRRQDRERAPDDGGDYLGEFLASGDPCDGRMRLDVGVALRGKSGCAM